jgi:hypothetical protein
MPTLQKKQVKAPVKSLTQNPPISDKKKVSGPVTVGKVERKDMKPVHSTLSKLNPAKVLTSMSDAELRLSARLPVSSAERPHIVMAEPTPPGVTTSETLRKQDKLGNVTNFKIGQAYIYAIPGKNLLNYGWYSSTSRIDNLKKTVSLWVGVNSHGRPSFVTVPLADVGEWA